MTHSSTIKFLYKEKALAEVHRWAKSTLSNDAGDKNFFQFQRKILQDTFAGFRFDFGTLSTIQVNANFEVDTVKAICLDIPDASAEQYKKIAQHDDMSPLAYVNAGRALNYTDVRAHEEWLEHPLFKEHCLIYEIHQAIMVCFCYPGHRQTFIAFEYLGSADNRTWKNFEHSKLELASFPFALAWLYRRQIIDESELTHRFKALSGLTELQLERLRKYINSPLQSFKEQAKDLEITEPKMKTTIYDVREKVAGRFGWEDTLCEGTHRNSLRGLDAEYSFLRLLGDNTRPLILNIS